MKNLVYCSNPWNSIVFTDYNSNTVFPYSKYLKQYKRIFEQEKGYCSNEREKYF